LYEKVKDRKSILTGVRMENNIKNFMREFQVAYQSKDIPNVSVFVSKFFTQNAVYYGTSSTELCVGSEKIISLVKYDWSYWGLLELDIDNAHVNICGDAAGFVTTGCVKWNIPKESFLEKVKADIREALDSPCSLKECTMRVNNLTSKALLESERGELHILPIRISAMLCTQNDTLKICQLVISHPTAHYPDSRLYE